MPNSIITNNDLSNPILEQGEFKDDTLTFAGAGTIVAGTILARDSVSKKLVPFVKGGVTNENGIPKIIITYDVTAAVAGDEPVRVGISGSYRKEKLVIDADGNDSNIDAVVIDQLRNYSLIPVSVTERLIPDNQ